MEEVFLVHDVINLLHIYIMYVYMYPGINVTHDINYNLLQSILHHQSGILLLTFSADFFVA